MFLTCLKVPVVGSAWSQNECRRYDRHDVYGVSIRAGKVYLSLDRQRVDSIPRDLDLVNITQRANRSDNGAILIEDIDLFATCSIRSNDVDPELITGIRAELIKVRLSRVGENSILMYNAH